MYYFRARQQCPLRLKPRDLIREPLLTDGLLIRDTTEADTELMISLNEVKSLETTDT